jgi:CTP synthase
VDKEESDDYKMDTKYVFITGGVVSSLGKGITAASLGRLLKARGLKVSIQKFDPYLNMDPGKMSPYQHGEVFVTDDGTEADLDLGHYERLADISLNKNCSVTTGKVYWSVLNNELRGDYGGGTIQVIPHITNEIKERITRSSKDDNVDVVITEIGGTIGDIEILPFLEAIRQFKYDVGIENIMHIHVTLMPYLGTSGEMKTKPTQHSVKELRGIGIQPDIIMCRTERQISKEAKQKIALFCNVESKNVMQNIDAESLYEVPLLLEKEGLGISVCKRLGLPEIEPDLEEWSNIVNIEKSMKKSINISLIGKYVELRDAYLSVAEALKHAGIANNVRVNIDWIQADDVNSSNVSELLKHSDGIIIPDGSEDKNINGLLLAIQYARENDIPFLGLCLGMQLAIVEFARNVAGLSFAESMEFNPTTTEPVINLMPEQKDSYGTKVMRIGTNPCKVIKDTKAYNAYDTDLIYERHRNEYEFNNYYKEILQEKGLIISGMSPDERLVEIVELKDHLWFIATQYRPEFKSRPTKPHPLFKDFVGAANKLYRIGEIK